MKEELEVTYAFDPGGMQATFNHANHMEPSNLCCDNPLMYSLYYIPNTIHSS